MIITVDNVIDYLIDKKLVNVKSIVDGNLEAVDISRKNSVIKVIMEMKSYLLKQLDFSDSKMSANCLKEPLLYKLVHSGSTLAFLKSSIPRLYEFDAKHNILIIDFLRDSTSLFDLYVSQGPKYWQIDIASTLGALMGRYHLKLHKVSSTDPRFSFLPKETPWILSAHQPGPDVLSNLTAEAIRITKIIQNYDFASELDILRKDWRNETLIHGDIRFDNVLVSNIAHPRKPTLKLVDWEMVDYGDSAWDIAGVLHGYLSIWILNVKPEPGMNFTPDFALKELWPSIKAFWFTYLKARKPKPGIIEELLVRAAKFCAARLLQSAYELQFSPQFSNQTIMMLQASKSILLKPQDAIIHLFGIPFKL